MCTRDQVVQNLLKHQNEGEKARREKAKKKDSDKEEGRRKTNGRHV